jgi:hypothetical protein
MVLSADRPWGPQIPSMIAKGKLPANVPTDFGYVTDAARMSNDKIADRKAIHFEWITPISPRSAERQLDREKITVAPPISSEVAQPPIDREGIRMAPSIPREPAQRQVSRKEIKKLLKRGKADFGIARRDVKAATRRAPLTDAYAGDSTNAPKGFWDWSQ